MGWAHAGLAILAVVGAPPAVYGLLPDIYWPDTGWAPLYDDLSTMIFWVPAPVVVGITLWRRRVFGEQPRADGRTTLPAMTTAAILGMWWLLLISGPVRHWAGW